MDSTAARFMDRAGRTSRLSGRNRHLWRRRKFRTCHRDCARIKNNHVVSLDIVKLTCLAIRCLAFALCGMVAHAQEISPRMTRQKFQLVVHGGAGTIERSEMTPEKEQEYRAGIENALRAGREILQGGGSSLDAVEAAVRVLEDDPHFNAGKGSVFTSAGTNEMDAAIMDGKTLAAGAVAADRACAQSDRPGPRRHGKIQACDDGWSRR